MNDDMMNMYDDADEYKPRIVSVCIYMMDSTMIDIMY